MNTHSSHLVAGGKKKPVNEKKNHLVDDISCLNQTKKKCLENESEDEKEKAFVHLLIQRR